MDGDGNSSGSGHGGQEGRPSGLQESLGAGGTLRVEGTNVLRVPFGVRRSRRERPERPDHWATLVLPFHADGRPNPTPPQAA
jgi:hypothetical protein